VQRRAAGLIALGLNPGDRFAIWMRNSADYLELYYAAAASRTVVVPLNLRWTQQETEWTLRDAGASLIVADEHCEAEARATAARLKIPVLLPNAVMAPDTSNSLLIEPTSEDLFGLFYTSGSTGGSKGVMLTQHNVAMNACQMLIEIGIREHWSWLHSAPMFHLADGAFSFAITMAGGTHVFIPSFQPASFLEAVEQFHVTSALLIPTMLNMVLSCPEVERFQPGHLRHIFYGASPMPPSLLERGIQRFQCGFWQAYGMTETSPVLTLSRPEDHCLDHPAEPRRAERLRSAGRPVTGVEISIAGVEGSSLAPRQVGEIRARGDILMKGYWNRPELTSEALRDGWMHTGDIGYMDEDGYVFILDRLKDMIKSGGENVYTPEVEAALLRHPAVSEACVVGAPDDQWGEIVLAAVSLHQGDSVQEEELIGFCRSLLSRYKCPRRILFLDSLPKNGAGKIQRRVLREELGRSK
jgi:long-chain acyl-CoA synthetase